MHLLKLLSVFFCLVTANSYASNTINQTKIDDIVGSTIGAVAQKYAIPGMAVAVTVDGKNYFYNYGVASKATQQPVTNQTLFEIGSISKTFTVTLATYAQINGKLSLYDSASTYLPELHGSSFDDITLLNLATHTSGGLPLQVPDKVTNTDQLMKYYQQWQPIYPAGTHRTYSNPSIGLLSIIAAKSMEMSFTDALEKKLFPELGMLHSYINVPADQMSHYAQGYTEKDAAVRVNPGVLASEAYGVKSNSADMIQFINANMNTITLDEKWQHAITDTHTGYFTAGPLTQDLIWEQYPYPVKLKTLLAGNSYEMIYQSTKTNRLNPPLAPQNEVLINKTGSTGGFGAYVAFIPAKKVGVVILANKNYPADARVKAAYRILKELDATDD